LTATFDVDSILDLARRPTVPCAGSSSKITDSRDKVEVDEGGYVYGAVKDNVRGQRRGHRQGRRAVTRLPDALFARPPRTYSGRPADSGFAVYVTCLTPASVAFPEDISDVLSALNPPTPVIAAPTVERNDPCPCGSGKKFKKCCDGKSGLSSG
jgi:hypothetical protein